MSLGWRPHGEAPSRILRNLALQVGGGRCAPHSMSRANGGGAIVDKRRLQGAAARRMLGDPRLIAFLKAAGRAGEEGVFAVKLACDGLHDGEPLDHFIGAHGGAKWTLEVRQLREDTFEIEFGCLAGPNAGDRGMWEVVFKGDEVQSLVQKGRLLF